MAFAAAAVQCHRSIKGRAQAKRGREARARIHHHRFGCAGAMLRKHEGWSCGGRWAAGDVLGGQRAAWGGMTFAATAMGAVLPLKATGPACTPLLCFEPPTRPSFPVPY